MGETNNAAATAAAAALPPRPASTVWVAAAAADATANQWPHSVAATAGFQSLCHGVGTTISRDAPASDQHTTASARAGVAVGGLMTGSV